MSCLLRGTVSPFSSAITRLVCIILPDLPFCDLMPVSNLTSCCHMFFQYRRFVSSRGRGMSGYRAFVDGYWTIYALVTGSARMPSASNLRRASSRAQVWMLVSVSCALLTSNSFPPRFAFVSALPWAQMVHLPPLVRLQHPTVHPSVPQIPPRLQFLLCGSLM